MKNQLKILAEDCRNLRSIITDNTSVKEIIEKTDSIVNHIEDLIRGVKEGKVISSYMAPGINAELIQIDTKIFDININSDMWKYSTCVKGNLEKAMHEFNIILSGRQVLRHFDDPTPSPLPSVWSTQS